MVNIFAKPFLKWAGGKGQLISQISSYLPSELLEGNINTYIEPFLGGGAIFFYVAHNYKIKNYYLYDVNEDLVLVYNVIKNDVSKLITKLKKLQKDYLSLAYHDYRSDMYYELRKNYNEQKVTFSYDKYNSKWIDRASKLIFLNKTCFNGLYRVNTNGEFNVPHGDYKNPTICDEVNLNAVSNVLQNALIQKADFEACIKHVGKKTFVYLDPPYRPISKTSSFNSYSNNDFNDNEQKRLAKFYTKLNIKGAKLMLSNSDPQNQNPNDNFFEEQYSKFNINKVNATRMINSNAKKRGEIKELLITNY